MELSKTFCLHTEYHSKSNIFFQDTKEKTDEYTNIEEMVDGMLIKVARYESIISFEIGKMKDDFYDLADKIEKGNTK